MILAVYRAFLPTAFLGHMNGLFIIQAALVMTHVSKIVKLLKT